MEYPPRLTEPEPSRQGMLLALARCIFEMHYREEMHARKGPVKTFDNMCSGDLERVAGVLRMAGFTRFSDDIGRRSVFVRDPGEFEEAANSNRAENIDMNLIEEAVIRLADSITSSSVEIDNLAETLTLNGRKAPKHGH